VRQVASDGTTVLLTTQYLEEADRLAERLAVIDHGRVIAEGTSADLKSSIGTSALHFQLINPEQRPEAQAVITRLLGDGMLPPTEPGSMAVKVADAKVAADVLGALTRSNIQFTNFSLGAPSLDDVFFALTGRPREAKAAPDGKPATSPEVTP
jgi:ABC-2 type transport system ATP-binding protein